MRIPAILFAISIHECAHAWTANYFGDPTAKMEGRITLNPIVHLDVLGAICFIFAGFGWGKPVPVNRYNLRNPVRDDMMISAAGPLSNFASAVVFALVFRAISPFVTGGEAPFVFWFVRKLCLAAIWMSVVLGVFNLIPIFPLDGSHVLKGLLPRRMVPALEQLERIGPVLLLVLIFTNIVSIIIGPVVSSVVRVLIG